MTIFNDKKNELPILSTFSNFIDNVFERNFPDIFGTNFNSPAVNVIENKDNFQLEVAAPGMDKKDFNLKINNNILSIGAKIENHKEEKNDNYARKEFGYSSFERSFTLPKNVNADNINASYENGILKIIIPKKEDINQNYREININ